MTGFAPLVSDKNSSSRLADGLKPWQAVRDMVLGILCTAQKHAGCRRAPLERWQIDAEAYDILEPPRERPWTERRLNCLRCSNFLDVRSILPYTGATVLTGRADNKTATI